MFGLYLLDTRNDKSLGSYVKIQISWRLILFQFDIPIEFAHYYAFVKTILRRPMTTIKTLSIRLLLSKCGKRIDFWLICWLIGRLETWSSDRRGKNRLWVCWSRHFRRLLNGFRSKFIVYKIYRFFWWFVNTNSRRLYRPFDRCMCKFYLSFFGLILITMCSSFYANRLGRSSLRCSWSSML